MTRCVICNLGRHNAAPFKEARKDLLLQACSLGLILQMPTDDFWYDACMAHGACHKRMLALIREKGPAPDAPPQCAWCGRSGGHKARKLVTAGMKYLSVMKTPLGRDYFRLHRPTCWARVEEEVREAKLHHRRITGRFV